MPTLLALSLLVTFLLAPAVGAYKIRHKPAGYIDNHLHPFRLHVNNVRAAKCLPRYPIGVDADELPVVGSKFRKQIRVQWKRRHWQAADAGSSCQPMIPWPWDALARCESGGDWDYNGGSGFDGGLQFLPSTWTSARQLVGVSYTYAWQAPAIVQVRVAQAWLARTSWGQWPSCSVALGLR